jgi:dienelactone hydrolase
MQHHADRIANLIASRGPHAVAAKLLARRYGWCGFAPSTIEALAEQDHTTVALMSRRLRSAENTIRHAE